MDPDDALALRLYEQIKRVGWDMVATLRPLQLNAWSAEMLLMRLQWLCRYEQQRHEALQHTLQGMLGPSELPHH